MTKQRKSVTMVVTVSVPVGVTPAEARQEVRTLINHQSNWKLEESDVKVLSVRPA